MAKEQDGFALATQDVQINLEQAWERRNWANWLGCSEEQLRNAVESIGTDPDNVRRFLRQAR